MGKLDGKVAVITGGSDGIGLSTAKAFVGAGAQVFITGRRKDMLDKAAAEIGGQVTAVQADSSQLADLDRLYQTIKASKGHVDIVFANAGVGDFVDLEAVTPEFFDKIFDLNVRGTYFTVQKLLPLMSEGGSIIMVGSIAGSKGIPKMSVYSGSKAALRAFARGWTQELAKRGIRVNVLSPGPIRTPLAENLDPQAMAGIIGSVPMGRMGVPEEIATAALFLASSDSSFVTGVELFADGGAAQV